MRKPIRKPGARVTRRSNAYQASGLRFLEIAFDRSPIHG